MAYRLNVGIVLLNKNNQVFWAEREDIAGAWQFPQGGIDNHEKPRQAMFRELKEEIGLDSEQVELIAKSKVWYEYQLPKEADCEFTGQRQKWFLLRLRVSDDYIQLNNEEVEFRNWKWVDYWYPLEEIVEFKRSVYRQVLNEFFVYIEQS